MAMEEKLMELMAAGQKGPKKLSDIEIEVKGESEDEGEEENGMDAEETPPMASPMSTPEPKLGSKEGAMINIQMALDLLQQSLPAVGSDSAEGKELTKVIGSLSKAFGSREAKTRELIPAEIMQMIQSLPQAGGASPEQRVAALAPLPGTQQPPIPM
jgi:hypothetical protein